MMPDDGRGTEAERPPLLLQPPTDVHVIARRVELRIEAADGLQRGDPKGHVAAGNVFGLAIGQQHMDRPPRGMGHAIGNQTIAGRRDIWAADASKVLAARIQERRDQVSQPLPVRIGIIVNVGDNFARGGHQTGVACMTQAVIRRAEQPETVFAHDTGGVVGGPVIDHNDFEIWILEPLERVAAIADGPLPIIGANHH